MSINKFVAPEIIFGPNSLAQVGDSILRLGAKKVFVVTDPGLIEAGWINKTLEHLAEVNLDYEIWSQITANPKDFEISQGLEQYRKTNCDSVLAIGGGSPIDAAKAIALLATNPGEIKDYEGVDKITRPLPPMIAMSTTAGSGAEVSQFAIIVDSKRRSKMTIVSKSLIPDIAIIDPLFLMTKENSLTANTGLDALTHAIEAYTSIAATPLTDVMALKAIKLIGENLRPSVATRTNLQAKTHMAMASLQAGLAFSNAILGAVHALSHQIGGHFDAAHGEINAILLPHIMEYNFLACQDKYVEIANALGVETNKLSKREAALMAIEEIRNLAKDVGVPLKLRQLDIPADSLELMANMAINDICLVTNPRDVNPENLLEILRTAW